MFNAFIHDWLTVSYCLELILIALLWLSIYFYCPLVSPEAACIARQCPQGCRLKPSGEAECFCFLGYRARPGSSCEGTSVLKLYHVFIEFKILVLSYMYYTVLIQLHVFYHRIYSNATILINGVFTSMIDRFNVSYIVSSEINECLDGVCPHTCQNTNGSVECGCYAGYSLQADQTSCKGMY